MAHQGIDLGFESLRCCCCYSWSMMVMPVPEYCCVRFCFFQAIDYCGYISTNNRVIEGEKVKLSFWDYFQLNFLLLRRR